METSVLRPNPEVVSGPVISHTPYSHLDCGPPLYTLTYTDTRLKSFMIYSQTTGEVSLDPQEHGFVGIYTL